MSVAEDGRDGFSPQFALVVSREVRAFANRRARVNAGRSVGAGLDVVITAVPGYPPMSSAEWFV